MFVGDSNFVRELFSISLIVILFLFGVATPYMMVQDDSLGILSNMQEDTNEEESSEHLQLLEKYVDYLNSEQEEFEVGIYSSFVFQNVVSQNYLEIADPPPKLS